MLARLATLVLCVCALPSFAGDGVGGSVDVVSDYAFRGISLSNGRPAAQADLHYVSTRGYLVGVWGSTVELNWWEGRTAEFDAYLGYSWPLNMNWSTKLTFVHYAYPFNARNGDYDYDEIVGSLGFRNNFSLTATWSYDASHYIATGDTQDYKAWSAEATGMIPLPRAFAANLGIGYYDLPGVSDAGYAYWNAGLGYDWRAWHFDVSYIGTNAHIDQLPYVHNPAVPGMNSVARLKFYNANAGDRLAATILWRF